VLENTETVSTFKLTSVSFGECPFTTHYICT